METLLSLPQRFIAFFDILGFSERLQTMPLKELHAFYARLIDDVRETVFSGKILDTTNN